MKKNLDLTSVLNFMNNADEFFEEIKKGLSLEQQKELEKELQKEDFKASIEKAKKEVLKTQEDLAKYGNSL